MWIRDRSLVRSSNVVNADVFFFFRWRLGLQVVPQVSACTGRNSAVNLLPRNRNQRHMRVTQQQHSSSSGDGGGATLNYCYCCCCCCSLVCLFLKTKNKPSAVDFTSTAVVTEYEVFNKNCCFLLSTHFFAAWCPPSVFHVLLSRLLYCDNLSHYCTW